MLTEYATQPPSYAESEMTRYLGWPGQAISYKVGERTILELRDEVRRSGSFDLKGFHTSVLSAGSIGLDHLRDWVKEEWPPQANSPLSRRSSSSSA